MNSWIDIHCHLDMLEQGPEEIIRLALERNVGHMVSIGTEPADYQKILQWSQEFPNRVSCTIGVHPHHGQIVTQDILDSVKTLSEKNPEVIAVGEIGLDYFYKNSAVEEQKKAFIEQLEIAAELSLPVEIHTRDAEEDTVEILKQFKGRVKGVIHCFTSSQWLAHQCLDLGYNISLSGVVTFKNADDLRKTAKSLPLDRIHVETDAPFLAPIPHRGKKNMPAFVVDTGIFVARELGMTPDELMQQTTTNTIKMFPRIAARLPS